MALSMAIYFFCCKILEVTDVTRLIKHMLKNIKVIIIMIF